jgi:hypothetical protein
MRYRSGLTACGSSGERLAALTARAKEPFLCVMVTPTCSQCGARIQSEDVNVAQDVAYCRACNLSFELSELTRATEMRAGVNLQAPPAGAWSRPEADGLVIGASHRSVGRALGALAISLFWNGIVSIFVLVALAGTLRNLEVRLPEWFPAPNMNDAPMSSGMTIFLWIFLTPFMVIGLAMIGAFLGAIGGRTEVTIRNGEGVVFTGLGPIGWRQRFDARAVRAVRIDDQAWSDSDGHRQRKAWIVIETRDGAKTRFGSMLLEERRRFVAGALSNMLTR